MMLESGRARVGKKVTSTPAPSPSLLQRCIQRSQMCEDKAIDGISVNSSHSIENYPEDNNI